jgi:hypothetical protein
MPVRAIDAIVAVRCHAEATTDLAAGSRGPSIFVADCGAKGTSATRGQYESI